MYEHEPTEYTNDWSMDTVMSLAVALGLRIRQVNILSYQLVDEGVAVDVSIPHHGLGTVLVYYGTYAHLAQGQPTYH